MTRPHCPRQRPRATPLGRTLASVLASTAAVLVTCSTPVAAAMAADPSPSGAVWPLDPRPAVVAGFTPPPSRYAAGHRGVDLAGVPGQEVRATLPGRVTYAGRIAGRGVVVVSHGPVRTTYEPVAASVSVGSEVGTGDGIGSLEAVPGHCRPSTCLHWGLIEGQTYLNPLSLVGAGPVRLLPLGPPGRLDLPPSPPAAGLGDLLASGTLTGPGPAGAV